MEINSGNSEYELDKTDLLEVTILNQYFNKSHNILYFIRHFKVILTLKTLKFFSVEKQFFNSMIYFQHCLLCKASMAMKFKIVKLN